MIAVIVRIYATNSKTVKITAVSKTEIRIMDRIIKLFLALLFFLCLLDMPYGFYQFVRFSAMVGFAMLAYHASSRENKTEMIVYIGLAILFQPLIKISLGRELWNTVDVIVGIGLLLSIFRRSNEKSSGF